MEGWNWFITHDFSRFKISAIILLVKPHYCPWKCPMGTLGISSSSHDGLWNIASLGLPRLKLSWEIILNYTVPLLSTCFQTVVQPEHWENIFLHRTGWLLKLSLAEWTVSCIIWRATLFYWQKCEARASTVSVLWVFWWLIHSKQGPAQQNNF